MFILKELEINGEQLFELRAVNDDEDELEGAGDYKTIWRVSTIAEAQAVIDELKRLRNKNK